VRRSSEAIHRKKGSAALILGAGRGVCMARAGVSEGRTWRAQVFDVDASVT
jgi:hypothetical protein